MSNTARWRAAVLAAAALLVTACGGAGEDPRPSGGGAGAPAPVAGFDGTTITLGVLSPLSGPVAVVGKPITAGNRVWFDHVNAQGGIAGRYPVRLLEEDTQYRADIAVQRYHKIKDEVVAFAQVNGTTSTQAVLPLLEADKMMAAPASGDAEWVREENLLPTTAPYQIQAINSVHHYLTEGGGSTRSRICTLVQDDAYGEAGQQGIDFAAERAGFRLASTQRFKPGTENYAGQIGALARAGCQMVFLTATPTDAGRIWGAAAQAAFAPQWYGQAPCYTDALVKSPLAPYLRENVIMAFEGTEWGDPTVPGMGDMVERIAEFASDQQPSFYFLFGYNQARAVTMLLEQAVRAGDLSREGILSASRALGTVTFDGLSGDYAYGPVEQRNPPRTTTLFRIDPAKPFGLATLKYNFTSDVAAAYPF